MYKNVQKVVFNEDGVHGQSPDEGILALIQHTLISLFKTVKT